jgi:hypothetical protein
LKVYGACECPCGTSKRSGSFRLKRPHEGIVPDGMPPSPRKRSRLSELGQDRWPYPQHVRLAGDLGIAGLHAELSIPRKQKPCFCMMALP